ncbi:DUF302 domain-containing protein [Acidithiobacillus sp.]|jgi:uncharacterized protein (DUF302 family)|uniref:DUF302 domain-containing protein n=1 Tax=Acidithiobacillus sp. TaxID=1872118 RepID=UPI0025BA9A71|nr:DUF302 domain-containing protein [Acidithiobacillus sp.]MCK9189464.1 DUF302 domain-containing protein [Acidithiobacillus sp.]MCK9359009.1 DUF302 domain-containing protein [Acidithiobacillus sp.]
MTTYAFSTTTTGSFPAALAKVTEALKAEGFGVLTEIDVAATLKAKLGIDSRPYRILGACNPQFAHQAIEADPDIGLLLPCNVIVREEANGQVTVGFMDPAAVLGMVGNPQVTAIGEAVRAKLVRVKASLETT